ncbi:hypothetical protein N9N67_00215 [Bacteriovoracaceae bacterium]|nr:hypothetical protein [Bacteriovoracaceae bacterium]
MFNQRIFPLLFLAMFIFMTPVKSDTVQEKYSIFEDYEGNILLIKKTPDNDPPTILKNFLRKFDRNWSYNNPIATKDGNIQAGFGFSFGYSSIPDDFFQTTYNGETGYFGEVYDNSETVFRNNGLLMSINLEVRFLHRLKVGTDLDFHMRKEGDDDGSIIINNGVWNPIGDRVSTISNQGDTLGELLTQSYTLYSEFDVIAIPAKKINLLLSPGVFYKNFGTSHYVGILPVQDDDRNDYGIRLSLTPTETGYDKQNSILPLRISLDIGFNGSKSLKLGFLF